MWQFRANFYDSSLYYCKVIKMNCWYESEAIGRMPCKARTLGFAPEIYFWLSSYRGTLKCGAVMMMKSLGPGHSKSIWPAITDSREENIKTLTKYQAKARRLMVSASFWVEKTFLIKLSTNWWEPENINIKEKNKFLH